MSTTAAHDHRLAALTSEPTAGERLMLAAIKAWASLRVEGDRPHGPVGDALAARTSPRTAALFAGWIQAVEQACHRPIVLACPGCGGPSADAQRLVVACGLAPTNMDVALRLLAPLLRQPQMVCQLAKALNAGLAKDGLPLPARLGDLEAKAVRAATLH